MLIGLHGKKQAGKDTVYGRIQYLLGIGSPTGAVVERVAFADPMYAAAAEALGVSVPVLQELKTDPAACVALVWEHSDFHEMAPEGISRMGHEPRTVRQFIQEFGQGHRRLFGEEFWVERVDLSHDRRIKVVTDVRMPNEAEAVIAAGGHVVKVVGPPDVEDNGDTHVTERELPERLISRRLYNVARGIGFGWLDWAVLSVIRDLIVVDQKVGKWPL